ncbi:MAG: MMPL family transporter [Pseudomonadota bacterium]
MHSRLGCWADWITRAAWWIVIVAVLLTGFSLYYTVHNLGIHTDTGKMLSPDLSFQQALRDYRQAFPQYTDTLVVVVESSTPDRAGDAAATLAQRLTQEPDLFTTVYLPYGGKYLDEHGLLYLSSDELQKISDNLAAIQPFLGKLTRDQSLHGLFAMLVSALEAVQDGEPLELSPLLDKINEAVRANLAGHYYQLSWQELIHGKTAGEETHKRLVILQPQLEYSQLQPAKTAIHTVRELVRDLRLDPAHGVRVRITGKVALAHEELQTASRGALMTGLITLALVGTVLLVGLGSWQLFLASVLTMTAGLIMTAGFAAFAVGELNLISIAFAVLYIGLGIDYSIHLSLRYLELIRDSTPHAEALREALTGVGGSLFICTLTTATGFYAFVPTSFAGVSELGLIAGTGMIISLLLNLSLLPALLFLLPPVRKGNVQPRHSRIMGKVLGLPRTHARTVLWAALTVGVVAVLLLPGVHFDFNPLHLRDPQSESVITFRELLESSTTSPWRITVLTDDAVQANSLATQLEQLDVVDRVHSIEQFIPADQAEKLLILKDLALIVGAEFELQQITAMTGFNDNLKAVKDLLETLDRFVTTDQDRDLSDAAARLRRGLKQFLYDMAATEAYQQDIQLSELEESLLGALPRQLHRLDASLNARAVKLETLPNELLTRWVTDDGRYRLEVLPARPLDNDANLREFVTRVQSVSPNATESAVVNVAASQVVVDAFIQALTSAMLVITLLLLLLLPDKSDVLLVLSPLLLAAGLTGAMAVLLHLPFNYANVIALPLIMGVGVDSGIHMVHRFRSALPSNRDLLGTSTGRAVALSSLTTLCSFGSLAFSMHPGAASMGKMLTIGITATMLCMLVVLPALIYRHIQSGTAS